MIRSLIMGAVVSVCALGAHHAVADWRVAQSLKPKEQKEGVEQRRARPKSVPIFENGAVAGYVVVQLTFDLERDKAAGLGDNVETYASDALLRLFLTDPAFNHKAIDRYDLADLTAKVKKDVNQLLRADLVRNVLVTELNFVRKDDIRR